MKELKEGDSDGVLIIITNGTYFVIDSYVIQRRFFLIQSLRVYSVRWNGKSRTEMDTFSEVIELLAFVYREEEKQCNTYSE
jgi:hypothetical protein